VSHRALVVCVLTDVLTAERFCQEAVLKPLRAYVFRFTNLRPLRRYRINLERTENPRQFTGVLTTPSAATKSKLNAVVVSGDRPSQLSEGDPSMWQALSRRLQEPWCGIDVVLHIGGQVALGPTARECLYYVLWRWGHTVKDEDLGHGHQRFHPRTMADRTAEESQDEDRELTGLTKHNMEELKEEVRGRFRTQYRKQWNSPHKKAVLSCCSHIMMWSDKDIMEGWSWKEGGVIGATDTDLTGTVSKGSARRVAETTTGPRDATRISARQIKEKVQARERLSKARQKAGALVVSLARDVYHEYQRSLWYEDFVVGADEREQVKEKRRGARAERKRLAEMEEQERQAYKQAKGDFEAKKRRELELEGHVEPPTFLHITSSHADDSKTVVPCNRDRASSSGAGCRFGGNDSEYHFQQWGNIGVVFLNMHDYAHQVHCLSQMEGYHHGTNSANPKIVAMAKELQVKLCGAAPQPLDEREQCCLSERQWRFLKKKVLRSGVRALVVVSETPAVFMSREEGRAMETTMRNQAAGQGEEERPISTKDSAAAVTVTNVPEEAKSDEGVEGEKPNPKAGQESAEGSTKKDDGKDKGDKAEGDTTEANADKVEKTRARRQKKQEYRPASRAVQGHWIHRPKMVRELLAMLYQWRDDEDGREVVLLGGGAGCGIETTVTDVSMQMDMLQAST